MFLKTIFQGGSVGSDREAEEKENPRVTYAVGFEPNPRL